MAAKRRSRRVSDATDEDDGYLVSFVTDENNGTSECVLLDAKHIQDGPGLPHRAAAQAVQRHARVWADRKFVRDGVL